jgi:hypothetical protein
MNPTLLNTIHNLRALAQSMKQRGGHDWQFVEHDADHLEWLHNELLKGVERCMSQIDRGTDQNSAPMVIFNEMLGLPADHVILEWGDCVLTRPCPACKGEKDEVHLDDCPALNGKVLYKEGA